jgi:hypothetical protein
VGASLAWLLVAPAYAWPLALVARLAAPLLEKTGPMRYEVSGSRVHVIRPVQFENERRPSDLVYIAWAASANFGVPLLAAFIVATPGWTWRRRGRALAWGLGLLTLTQVAFMLVTIEFWQQMPTRTPSGSVVYLPGHSPLRLRIVSSLYYFFEIMGRGFFALLVYFGLIVTIGSPRRLAPGTVGPNDPCPCGSGRKFKRCCGAIRR